MVRYGRAAAIILTVMLALAASQGLSVSASGSSTRVGIAYEQIALPEVNDRLTAQGFPALPGSVWTVGWWPVGQLNDGLRLGTIGAAGTYAASDGDRQVRLALAYGGVRLGYERTLSDRLSLNLAGSVLGGVVALTAVRGSPPTFDAALGTPYETTVYRWMVAAMAEAGPTLDLGAGLRLEGAAGYRFDTGLSGGWRDSHFRPLSNSPATSLSGWALRLSVAWGGSVPSAERPGVEQKIRELEKEIEEVSEPYLGVYVTDVGLFQRWFRGVKGAYVESVVPGSPAERVGLRKGDIILAIDRQRVGGANQLIYLVKLRRPGDIVFLEVWSSGRTYTLSVQLGRRARY